MTDRIRRAIVWVTGGSWRTCLHRVGIALTVATGLLEFAHILAPGWALATAALGLATRLDRARRVIPLFPSEDEPITAVEKMP